MEIGGQVGGDEGGRWVQMWAWRYGVRWVKMGGGDKGQVGGDKGGMWVEMWGWRCGGGDMGAGR